MFDNYVFVKNSCKNVVENGRATGFEMKTLITYYRGIPLSMIHDVRVDIDGIPVPRENIRFTVDGEDWFTLAEMETVTTYKWEFGEEATVFVKMDGGLAKGEHLIRLFTSVRPAYVPMPFGGERIRKVHIR